MALSGVSNENGRFSSLCHGRGIDSLYRKDRLSWRQGPQVTQTSQIAKENVAKSSKHKPSARNNPRQTRDEYRQITLKDVSGERSRTLNNPHGCKEEEAWGV